MAEDVYPAHIAEGDSGHIDYHNDHTDDFQDHKTLLHPQHFKDFPEVSDITPADGSVYVYDAGSGQLVPLDGVPPSEHGSTHEAGGSDPIPGIAGVSSNALIVAFYDDVLGWPLRATVTDDPSQPVEWQSRNPASGTPPTSTGYSLAGVDKTTIVNS